MQIGFSLREETFCKAGRIIKAGERGETDRILALPLKTTRQAVFQRGVRVPL